MHSTFSDADSMLNTVFLQFTKAVVQANFKMSCKHQATNSFFMKNNACFLGPFLQLNVGSVEKETEPADYNPNSTRSEKV